MLCRRSFTAALGLFAISGAACTHGRVLAPLDCSAATVEPLRADPREPVDEPAELVGQGDRCISATQASRLSGRLTHLVAEAAVEAHDERLAVGGAAQLHGALVGVVGAGITTIKTGDLTGPALLGTGVVILGAGFWRVFSTTGLEDLDAAWRRQPLETGHSEIATFAEREAALAALADDDLTLRNTVGSALVVVGGGFLAVFIWEVASSDVRWSSGRRFAKILGVGISGGLIAAGGAFILASQGRAERLWKEWRDVERVPALTLQPGVSVSQEGFSLWLGGSF